MWGIWTVVGILLLVTKSQGGRYISVCYYTSWSHTSNSNIRLDVEDIDESLCTHLVYAFGKFDSYSQKLVPASPILEISWSKERLYEKFNNLKKKNRNLKTILSVGGQNSEALKTFVEISKDKTRVKKLAQNSVDFLRKNNFDGLDVDWEYPTYETVSQYTTFLKVFSEVFEGEARKSNRRKLLLTVAVSAGKDKVEDGYEVPFINRYVDYIFLMAYDFSGNWSRGTGFDSPLMPRKGSSSPNTVSYAVNTWLREGADRKKLVLGMTGAGAYFQLVNSTNHSVGTPFIHKPIHGPLFRIDWRLAYPEICTNLHGGWIESWSADQKVPFAYFEDKWVGYDDAKSIGWKVDFLMDQSLAGAMFWELRFDDPYGNYCGAGRFPLTNVIKKKLGFTRGLPLTNNVSNKIRLMVMARSGGTQHGGSAYVLFCVLLCIKQLYIFI